MSRLLQLMGQRYGRLVVIEPSYDENNKLAWLCKCDCGNTKIVTTRYLRSRDTRSCGCWELDNQKYGSITHGMTKGKGPKPPEFTAWSHAKGRCYNTNEPRYKDYGGRGIKMCDEWLNNFARFYLDIGPRPSPKHSLDRIDVNGNYEPSNCRWANWHIQANNKRKKVFVDTEAMSLKEMSRRAGVNYKALHHLVHHNKQEPLYAVGYLVLQKA